MASIANATVNELKNMGDAGMAEITRRYKTIFPDTDPASILGDTDTSNPLTQAAALELYVSYAYTRVNEIIAYRDHPAFTGIRWNGDGVLPAVVPPPEPFYDYWNVYDNIVLTLMPYTIRTAITDQRVPTSEFFDIRRYGGELDTGIASLIPLILLNREDPEQMADYWAEDRRGPVDLSEMEDSVSLRIWNASLDDTELIDLRELGLRFRALVRERESTLADFFTLVKNIEIALKGSATIYNHDESISIEESRGLREENHQHLEREIQMQRQEQQEQQEQRRQQRQQRQRQQRQERQQMQKSEETSRLIEEALKADDQLCTHLDEEGHPIDTITFDPLDMHEDIIVRFYDVESRKGYCFALSTIMAHWGNMMESRQYRVTRPDRNGVVLQGTALLTIPEPMIFGKKLILPTNAFKTLQNITRAGKTTFYLAPSDIVITQVGTEEDGKNIRLYELRHSPRAPQRPKK